MKAVNGSKMKIKKIKRQTYLNLLLWIIILILINFISSYFYTRIDLTSEKRYTLTDATKELLNKLDDIVYVQVYLEGDMNAGFIRLRNSTKEMLDEFRIYAKDNIEYEFINPFKDKNSKAQQEIIRQFLKKGLKPTTVTDKDNEGKISEKILIPGAILNYKGREVAVNLLKNNQNFSPEENLNNSIQEIEYEFIRGINRLMKPEKPKIAVLEGHGELGDIYMADALDALSEFYTIEIVQINGKLNALRDRIMTDSINSTVKNRYELLIIAKPDSSFSREDQYIIDQHIMFGGKVLWLLDGTTADMDSLAYSNATIAMVKDLNIYEQLFKYGVRINPDLVQDMQCGYIPVNNAIAGEKPNFVPVPWLYFPLLSPNNSHPITKNLDLIKTEFLSTIDTVGDDPEIKKTILLTTSDKTKVLNAPVRVALDVAFHEPDLRQFAKPHVPVAALLEGKFKTFFPNYANTMFAYYDLINYKEVSPPTKMIVVADGDIIKNPVRKVNGQLVPLPLGTDKWFPRDFYYGGNLDFILNAVNYLCDDEGIMSVRSRQLKLRLLDRAKLNEEKTFWQFINMVFPVLLIIIAGIIISVIRKKKYTT
ncbi:MAG: gliding motility-associated ABC transporter substrate-binding protein GldG [Marinilabiliales bacterium]